MALLRLRTLCRSQAIANSSTSVRDWTKAANHSTTTADCKNLGRYHSNHFIPRRIYQVVYPDPCPFSSEAWSSRRDVSPGKIFMLHALKATSFTGYSERGFGKKRGFQRSLPPFSHKCTHRILLFRIYRQTKRLEPFFP